MSKEEELLKYSDPTKVLKAVKKYLGKHVELYVSTRKNKKYMVQSPEGKWIHFGQMSYKDGTLNDTDRDQRRQRFLKRNAKWSEADPYTPSFLSYYLLWK